MELESQCETAVILDMTNALYGRFPQIQCWQVHVLTE